MQAPREPLPFTVVGGFLGAGKTTVLNHLLRHTRERIAVVVNDFGDVAIDAELIAAHDGDTITLANGCICCSLSDEFALSLPELLASDPPLDRVVVEASGISDPGAVAQYGTLPGFRLDATVVLADVTSIRTHAADTRIGAQVVHQLRRADLVLLTKTDLVDAATVDAVRRWLHDTVGDVATVEAPNGVVPPEVLVGDVRTEAHTDEARAPTHDAGHGAAHDASRFDSVTLHTEVPVDRSELTAWLTGLHRDVLRAKGLVWLADVDGPAGPRGRHAVNAVGTRCRITAMPQVPTASDEATSVLVLIGPAGSLAQLDVPAPWRAG